MISRKLSARLEWLEARTVSPNRFIRDRPCGPGWKGDRIAGARTRQAAEEDSGERRGRPPGPPLPYRYIRMTPSHRRAIRRRVTSSNRKLVVRRLL
jgi:hypothetical protein